ncbi:competence protein ComEC [Nibricoccus aquaticus]|uniref:Competence protein ComEC n=1 Tax=Nibricoccus aquaticus TaxID=2576891 RepID=A0A290QK94_9BACT|nr:competence protein ComEC [Nibricoccus aquaticus]
MIGRCLRHRAPVLWLLLPLMGGVIAGKILPWSCPVGWLLGGAFAAAGIAVWFSNHARIWSIGLCLAVFLSGAAAYELRRARIDSWDSLPPREARLTLRIERVFPPLPDGKKVSGLATITEADTHLRELIGQRLYFSLGKKIREPEPARSSEIVVTGLLETLPREAPLATFEGFLTASGLNFQLTRGRVHDVSREAGTYALFCERMLERFGAILSHGLERQPALAGALRAMLLGQQHELGEEQTLQFRQSGTMHLFAISGLHIVVIAVALHGTLALLRLPRVAQVAIGLVALWLYVDITGGSPSAVRAFFMIALTHAALVLRLPVNPIATLSSAALVSLILDPMELFSASFQMSYGIVAALLLLGLPLTERWTERWPLFRDLPKATWRWHHHARDHIWRWLLGAVALGVSTTLISTVCGVVFFQLFTPGGLLANLVLIPVSSLVILGGFLSLLCGLAGLTPLCALFNHAAALVLAFMEWSIAWLLKIPGFFLHVEFLSTWAGLAVFGMVLASMVYGYSRQWTPKRGGFWPPFALTALALVLIARFG